MENNEIINKSNEILHNIYGKNAQFRDDQLDAIISTIKNPKTLLLQKTGWGKSLVYFIVTKIFRDLGYGPTIIISPLRSLMINQIISARKFGLKVGRINHKDENKNDGKKKNKEVLDNLKYYDAIIVSPESLVNANTDKALQNINSKLVVVDEIHCLSAWGNDFRPDYKRIPRVYKYFNDTNLLGTTATADDTVIEDINDSFGDNFNIIRGSLFRKNLSIQVNPTQTDSERLTWIISSIKEVPQLSGKQGIIYCLKTIDCEKVASYLCSNGINAKPYYNGSYQGSEVLKKFIDNDINIIVTTEKLGMGFDKSNIRFIIHYDLPKNLISYYQQIGRAGRDGNKAYAFLLHGDNDFENIKAFRQISLPDPNTLEYIVSCTANGISKNDLANDHNLNISRNKLETYIKYLDVNDYLYYKHGEYYSSKKYSFNVQDQIELNNNVVKKDEKRLEDLQQFINTNECYMRFIMDKFNSIDSDIVDCGICSNCISNQQKQNNEYPSRCVLRGTEPNLLPGMNDSAIDFVKSFIGNIYPLSNNNPTSLTPEVGWVLSSDYISNWSNEIQNEKYNGNHRLSTKNLNLAFDVLKSKVKEHNIDTIISVPSANKDHGEFVPDFAKRLAKKLGIKYRNATTKLDNGPEQKSLQNNDERKQNIDNSMTIVPELIKNRNILLVDDVVRSGITFDELSYRMLKMGANKVYPFALIRAGHNSK